MVCMEIQKVVIHADLMQTLREGLHGCTPQIRLKTAFFYPKPNHANHADLFVKIVFYQPYFSVLLPLFLGKVCMKNNDLGGGYTAFLPVGVG